MLNTIKQIKEVSNLYKTIGGLHRLHIISLLIGGEKNVGEINKIVKVSQPSLSQNLGILKRAGILETRRDQRSIYYFIKNPHVIRLLGVGVDALGGKNE